MELVKPEPLILNGVAHYTLTSYDPVVVQIEVPQITEKDVDNNLMAVIVQQGGTPASMNDDIWIRDHFDGIKNVRELRHAVREQMQLQSEQLVDEQKVAKCSIELSARLEQRVPKERVVEARRNIEQAFAMSLEQDGITEQEFYAMSGMRRKDMEQMLDVRAKVAAETEAALNAWIDHFGIEISDDEIIAALGIDPQQADQFMEEVKAAGDLEQMRSTARRSKALQQIVDECRCTYVHEGSQGDSGRPNLKLV